jgi:hypothetical protein
MGKVKDRAILFNLFPGKKNIQTGIMVPFSEINETERAAFEKMLTERLVAVYPTEKGIEDYSRKRKRSFKQKNRPSGVQIPAFPWRYRCAAARRRPCGADRIYLSVLG